MSSIRVRYIVDDVDAAVGFYRDVLGFTVDMHPGPGFAALTLDDLTLLLNAPGAGGAGNAGAGIDGGPAPGGWSRFQLIVDDLDAEVDRLKGLGVAFRGDVVKGNAGDQVLVEDPAGNVVELFQPHSA
jgi:catechol 2,3-dioxygenase-like lactoylglutathione lyase family enzyme